MTKFNMASVAMKLVVDAFLEVKRNPLLSISTERARNAQEAVEYFIELLHTNFSSVFPTQILYASISVIRSKIVLKSSIGGK